MSSRRVVVLAGGYGGARLSHGLALASAARAAAGGVPLDLAVVVNTGDDLVVHGMHVSPDLDTVMYTLSGWANDATGWGVRDETWSASDMLERYGRATWFQLGDRDLATHLLRTDALRRGERLTSVTASLAAALGCPARLLPMTDDAVRTELLVDGEWLEFQEYFVHRAHSVDVADVRYAGAERAAPTPEALEAVSRAELVVLAPSNPFLSIGAILSVPGMLDALRAAPAPRVAVSPIVAGAAVRGPAGRLLETLSGESSVGAVARHYRERYPGLVDALVIDELDAGSAEAIARSGMAVVVAQTVMRDHDDRRQLAEVILERFLPAA